MPTRAGAGAAAAPAAEGRATVAEGSAEPSAAPSVRPLARRALFAFLLVFIAARVLVIAIMAGRLPDLFLHLGKGNTHVHRKRCPKLSFTHKSRGGGEMA